MKTNTVLTWFVVDARNNRVIENNIPSRRIARTIKNLLKLNFNRDYRIGKMVVTK